MWLEMPESLFVLLRYIIFSVHSLLTFSLPQVLPTCWTAANLSSLPLKVLLPSTSANHPFVKVAQLNKIIRLIESNCL